MSERLINIRVYDKSGGYTLYQVPQVDPVEAIFRNLTLLRSASPFAVATIKKELKKFSCKSMRRKPLDNARDDHSSPERSEED